MPCSRAPANVPLAWRNAMLGWWRGWRRVLSTLLQHGLRDLSPHRSCMTIGWGHTGMKMIQRDDDCSREDGWSPRSFSPALVTHPRNLFSKQKRQKLSMKDRKGQPSYPPLSSSSLFFLVVCFIFLLRSNLVRYFRHYPNLLQIFHILLLFLIVVLLTPYLFSLFILFFISHIFCFCTPFPPCIILSISGCSFIFCCSFSRRHSLASMQSSSSSGPFFDDFALRIRFVCVSHASTRNSNKPKIETQKRKRQEW